MSEPQISAVIPVYNEVDSLPEMHRQLSEGISRTGRPYEVIYINDGSSDGSAQKLDEIAAADPNVGVVHFRRNFGKSPALAAGFEIARGQIVLTLDADLQDDPAMIPKFVERIEAGADLVSGWKQRRHDPLGKTMPSKVFNAVVRRVSGVPLRDFNCGFKAYRIECIRELSVYGGFHRFLPVLAGERGFKIEELVVNHRPREHGVSKYGIKRFFDGLLDLLRVLMVTRYRTRPVHFFGIPGLMVGSIGIVILMYLTVLWFMGEAIGGRPLLLLGVLMFLTAVQLIGIGLVGELLVRTTIVPREVFSVARQGGFLGSEQAAPSLPAGQATPELVPGPSSSAGEDSPPAHRSEASAASSEPDAPPPPAGPERGPPKPRPRVKPAPKPLPRPLPTVARPADKVTKPEPAVPKTAEPAAPKNADPTPRAVRSVPSGTRLGLSPPPGVEESSSDGTPEPAPSE